MYVVLHQIKNWILHDVSHHMDDDLLPRQDGMIYTKAPRVCVEGPQFRNKSNQTLFQPTSTPASILRAITIIDVASASLILHKTIHALYC
jgi:hypothetical protein